MKVLIVLLGVLLSVSALSIQEKWQEFKLKHGRNYKSAMEETRRFAIFQDNLREIEQHNEKYQRGESSYWKGVNRFADMTIEEFKAQILLPNITIDRPSGETFHAGLVDPADVPDSIDWTTVGAVTDVRDQGDCSSCYAFAATANIESAYFLKYNKLVNLSEQQMVDCSTSTGNEGCLGGFTMWVYDYVKEHGITERDGYPYIADEEACKKSEGDVKIESYVYVDQNEDALKAAVGTIGPVSVAIFYGALRFYEGGVYDDRTCESRVVDHAVLVVGYGTYGKIDFWRFKNSFGADWGEKGYCRMARNANNMCGINKYPVYPVVA